MEYVAIALGVVALIVAYLWYREKGRADKLHNGIAAHKRVVNVPYGVPPAAFEEANETLWALIE
jgi:hypothetical protein